jgi:alkanesulfonate monooxygenase SsuD/methylene tetrahydromethanopterin reductase-like flavin-dependent oxidoreductase (luciferase family)
MQLGLGLPISNPRLPTEWAIRAESCGFDTLALLDRLTYHNPQPLVALSVIAGATSRIRLQTEILLGPLPATALLAKQIATLDVMSGGRFTLGIGIGGREDDHAAAGIPITAGASCWKASSRTYAASGEASTTKTRPSAPVPIVRPARRSSSARSPPRHSSGSLATATAFSAPRPWPGPTNWYGSSTGSGPTPGATAAPDWSAR